MAKKGGVQQLQQEVHTDEDFEKFMERDGLLVMDVYTEWCGPCLGMVGSLKKIKLELGGDNLQLAICKSDTITYLSRFRNKSEPTWLFASHGKIVNCLFGTNVPRLLQLITEELELDAKYRNGEAERVFYEWTQLTPLEQVIEDERLRILEEQEKIEREAELNKRNAYITFVTDSISENMPDMGVTLLFPHYAKERDIHKKLIDPAEKCGLILKDRRMVILKESDFVFINFECENPIHPEICKILFKEDVYVCMWKTMDTELRPIVDVLLDFIQLTTLSEEVLDENGQPDPELALPPMFKPWKVPILDPTLFENLQNENENENEEIQNNESEEKEEIKSNSENLETVDVVVENTIPDIERRKTVDIGVPDSENEQENDGNENLTDDKEVEKEEIKENQEENGNLEINNNEDDNLTLPDEIPQLNTSRKASVSQLSAFTLESTDGKHFINIPALWAPANKRANSALIYLYFRHLTEHFLPPDPIPEPPHVALVFDAIKRRDIIEVMEQHNEAVLAYGYFNNMDPTKAKCIAKTTELYSEKKPTIEDKMVIKLAKKTSNALLNLTALGPCYVSLNTEIGRDECLLFFPKDYYVNEDDETIDNVSNVSGKRIKKGRKKRKKDSDMVSATDSGSNIGEDVNEDNVGELDDQEDGEIGEDGIISSENSVDKTSELGVTKPPEEPKPTV